MATSWNTGTTGSANTSTTCTFTIPAGVLTGDLMRAGFTVFCEVSTAPAIAFSGGGGAWTLLGSFSIGTNPEQAFNGTILYAYGYIYDRVATAGDPGAVITLTETGSSGATTWWAVAMGAWTGPSATQPDVAGAAAVNNATTGVSPSLTTGVAGDWDVEFLLGGTGSTGTPAAPAALTTRESVTSSAGVTAILADSNGSVGGAGTAIGNRTWTGGNSAANNTFTLFTIGLEPGTADVTGTLAMAMAAMGESLTGTETISGTIAAAMAPMALAATGTETGVDVTGTAALAMAAMAMQLGKPAGGGDMTVFVGAW